MNFVTIEYDPEDDMWSVDEEASVWAHKGLAGGPFYAAAQISGLCYEHLDKLQRYQFRVLHEDDKTCDQVRGLRFLGTEARWGEFVPATADQLILKNPL